MSFRLCVFKEKKEIVKCLHNNNQSPTIPEDTQLMTIYLLITTVLEIDIKFMERADNNINNIIMVV